MCVLVQWRGLVTWVLVEWGELVQCARCCGTDQDLEMQVLTFIKFSPLLSSVWISSARTIRYTCTSSVTRISYMCISLVKRISSLLPRLSCWSGSRDASPPLYQCTCVLVQWGELVTSVLVQWGECIQRLPGSTIPPPPTASGCKSYPISVYMCISSMRSSSLTSVLVQWGECIQRLPRFALQQDPETKVLPFINVHVYYFDEEN